MGDDNERLALWLAFTVSNFTADEIELLAVSLQTKQDDLRAIVNKTPIAPTRKNPYRDGDWFESCKADDQS